MMKTERSYIYLDSRQDREKLIDSMKQTRQDVRQIVKMIPESEWYSERYHGWSLAAMLGHLNFIDNIALLQIKAALLNIHPAIRMSTVDRLNNMMSRIFKQRVVATSLRGMEHTERRIADFVVQLPMRQLSKKVFYPVDNQYTTVERVIQDYFVFHWQGHLQTMQDVERIRQSSE